MENPEVPGQIGVQSIPLMVLFKDGKPVAQKLGAAPKSQLKGWLESDQLSVATSRAGRVSASAAPPGRPTSSGVAAPIRPVPVPSRRPGRASRRAARPCRPPR